MIEYIQNTSYGSLIFCDNEIKLVKISALSYIKKLCQKNLFTLEGYFKSCKINLNYKKNIPIIIGNSLSFFSNGSLRTYESYFMNYNAILVIFSISDNECLLLFKSGRKLFVNLKLSVFKKRIKEIKKIQGFLADK